jgi:L-aminopeptidase/D-esterase-like protein
VLVSAIGAGAAQAVAEAIVRAVRAATSLPDLPAARDWPPRRTDEAPSARRPPVPDQAQS